MHTTICTNAASISAANKIKFRKMKRAVIWIFAIIVIIVGGLYYWFFQTPDKNINAFYLVPKDAMYIIETNSPVESWRRFSKSDVWKFLKTQKYFASIEKNADYLDSLINENSRLFSLFGNRDLLISAHKTSSKDYDFLFLLNLKKGTKIGIVEQSIETVLEASGYKVSKNEFKNKSIISAYDRKSKETMHFSVIQNYMLFSYSLQLVENSISEVENPQLGMDENFLKIYNETTESGLCKLYINYKYLDDFIQCYSNEQNPIINDLSNILFYSGLKVEVEDEYCSLEGYTNINDSIDSYLKALMLSGKGEITTQKILPSRTAVFHSLGFENGPKFYRNLLSVLQLDKKAFDEFESNKKLIERLLKIDLERDMMSWVDNEVSYAQNEPSKYTENIDDIMVVMKAGDIDYAKERLDFIAEQVRKRTPAKFKKVDYKTYTIKYLDIKGVFKLFFGKLFSKIEKPYYTIINNYVIFSNNPRTLVSVIEDYETGNTLEKNQEFDDFIDKFNKQSTVFSFIASNKQFPLMIKKMDATTRKSSLENEIYFRSFPQVGFQITEKEDKFYTNVRLNFLEYKPDTSKTLDSAEIAEETAQDMLDSMDDIQRFIAEKFEKNVIRDFYENSDNIRFEAETKKGELHGRYREFYETGELKLYGKYSRGEKRGVWRYYNKEGILEKKERFGVISRFL